MIKDLSRWASGRGVTPLRFVALTGGGVAGVLLTWWFPLYISKGLGPEEVVTVSNWEAVPAAAAVVWLIWCAPQMPTWERLDPGKLRWYAAAALGLGLLIPALVSALAWWWLNHVPSSMVPFYHRVFASDGERLADQSGAGLALAHWITGAVALTALVGIGICLLGKIAGVALAAGLWISVVLVQTSLGQLLWLRAPNYQAFGSSHVVVAATLAAFSLVAWWLTRGSKGRRWR
ncbi:MAG: hypothetical protein LBC97_01515 [Bifidobacteriaceae bacterium]|nr:hypothetical protein [Bifidobacteriaceae bacterium]